MRNRVFILFFTLILGWATWLWAADPGDAVLFKGTPGTPEIDESIIKMGGVLVSTVGASASEYSPARLATTGNITLSGEQTIDDVLTSASAVVVWQQTDATQNGIYTSSGGAWTRRTDADSGTKLAGNKAVHVQAGTRFAGTVFRVQNVSTITLGTTAVVIAPEAPQWYVMPTQTMTESGTIDCTPPTTAQVIGTIVPIVSTGGVVILGNPQITPGLRMNQMCLIYGTDSVAAVELSDGAGVRLGQSSDPVILTERVSMQLRWDGTVWQQVDQAGLSTGDAENITLQQACDQGTHCGWNVLTEARPLRIAPDGDTGPKELRYTTGGDFVTKRLDAADADAPPEIIRLLPDQSLVIQSLLGSPLSWQDIGSMTNSGGISMEFEGIFGATDNHIATMTGAHPASAISFTPEGTITSGTVQQAIAEVDGDVVAHVGDTTAAHAATAISFTPTGTIAATTVQAAIAEVASEGSGGIVPIMMGQLSLSTSVPSSMGISGTGSPINVWSAAGTFGGLICTIGTAPGSGNSWVIILRVAGSDTAVTCTIADSATSCTDVANSVAVTVGQLVEYSITPVSGPTATGSHRCGLNFTSS